MPVLVTGGAGYIGSHVAWMLIDNGEDVVVLDDLSSGTRSAVPPNAAFVLGNVADRELVAAILTEHRVVSVIHLAASANVAKSVEDPMAYYATNATASAAFLEVCESLGVEHFVFSSTAAVYGPAGPAAVDENEEPRPVSPYGRSKLITEWQLEDLGSRTGLRSVVLRLFNVAGADPLGRTGPMLANSSHLIARACEAAFGRLPHLDVYGVDYETEDGTCIRDYVHVSDVAAACLSALRYLRANGPSSTFNCGNGTGVSVLDIVEAVSHATGRPVPVVEAARRAGDIPMLVANPDRLCRELGWSSDRAGLDIIVSSTLEWQRRPARAR